MTKFQTLLLLPLLLFLPSHAQQMSYNSNQLLETIIHEFAIHLSKYSEVLDIYKKTNTFKDAKSIWNSVSEATEHHDVVKKNNRHPLKGTQNYRRTIQQVLNNNPSLKKNFYEADKNNKKIY